MQIYNTLRILGLLLMLFSITMLPPVLVSIWYHEAQIPVFIAATLATLILGFILWFPNRNEHREVRAREGFLIVTLLWCFLSVASAFPFAFSDTLDTTMVDALFEAVSGLTTTGATILTSLDSLPKSILYYRQQLQFIGGGGIIVFGIAVLPLLGVGGMQLFRAEMTGPFKEDKLTPRIAETAKTLWIIYLGLVLLCAIAYFLAGMGLFDAIVHSFSTISTGGFSTHDKSLGYFNNSAILWVATVFMILGAINFSLHFTAFQSKTLSQYWQDKECRVYLYYLLILTLLVTFALIAYLMIREPGTAFLESLFQMTSFSTTTGFFNTNYSTWPSFLPVLLMLIALIGGCSGSTAGGIKMIRIILMFKQWQREIQRLIHPNGQYVIKLGYSKLSQRTLDSVWGFFGAFVGIFALLLLLLLATGIDLLTAFSGLVAAITSTGLGLGSIADHFQPLSDSAKFILCIAMLAGRLELFTLLVLLSPSYWRR